MTEFVVRINTAEEMYRVMKAVGADNVINGPTMPIVYDGIYEIDKRINRWMKHNFPLVEIVAATENCITYVCEGSIYRLPVVVIDDVFRCTYGNETYSAPDLHQLTDIIKQRLNTPLIDPRSDRFAREIIKQYLGQ